MLLVECGSMKVLRLAVVAVATLQCGGEPARAPEIVGPQALKQISDTGVLVLERTIYVPIYSSLHVSDHADPVDLGATLSLRNISERVPVVVTAVEYYDSNGALVRNFLDSPAELGPMSTAEFYIARADRSGGSGANFLVRWGLREPGPDLLVEAVMHGKSGEAGVSFLTEGRVVETKTAGAPARE